ncbi:hypothetical protein [Perigonia lusca single nucleopolyhedrovirus]|uniref:Uncharacterized protein n=1 Tax=Perigonia lusca single nucleopolyhedrovirus TaxID=1675865 RepID=A0A0M3WR15_9ABAC|nr:hypothetical protein [Perigonia lusca single nucleopolyhedrovirus]AKN80598.1 hypothetical protein [Perigonia lusca single nucleopolyhedrovirus]
MFRRQPKSLSYYAYKSIHPYLNQSEDEFVSDYMNWRLNAMYEPHRATYMRLWNRLPVAIKNQEHEWKMEIKNDKLFEYNMKLQTWDWSEGNELCPKVYYILQIYSNTWKFNGECPNWFKDTMIVTLCSYKRHKLEEDSYSDNNLSLYDESDCEDDSRNYHICNNCYENENFKDNYGRRSRYHYILEFYEPECLTKEHYCYYLFTKEYWCSKCKTTPLFTMREIYTPFILKLKNDVVDNGDLDE